ncbi:MULTISPECIES: hypothetical protein [unclassified Cupriavidus]|jgi:hypothetical protein|uniref:hypothetical protein n=1 Tax=unclassified Cupriavidus TaxID=2640874 RepID=UPI001C003C1A|nr:MULTISPECIES: hypothetical protein [unclassified Cupriavidus]MCA3187444.1 hypothetical protein [Cupriavidus sp.]MCA3190666.1 hypothetical protein [Cupriavidus sp.]MCA3197371.1 hypothetical protein [Cupriavidus sp.]MCA3202648.1 hypothetical protein [Cupriavidus sp.]MCA3210091.1 hypothetical protein [Cupriavidus sp.]
MDGIYFLVLLAFGALTGALLALCAALGANLPTGRGGADDTGVSSAQPKRSASDRSL